MSRSHVSMHASQMYCATWRSFLHLSSTDGIAERSIHRRDHHGCVITHGGDRACRRVNAKASVRTKEVV
jgi:hypothetical protein